MNIKHIAAIALLSTGALVPVLADDQKPAKSQEGYVPTLNLMMVATQLSHFKLWYAGAVENWPLAIYELAQIRTGITLRAPHSRQAVKQSTRPMSNRA